MLACLNPLSINVFPRGSKVNKDGSPGCFLSFGYSDVLPDIGRYYRPFAVYGDDTPFTIDTHEGSVGYSVPCGRCVNCRRNKSFRWSRRLLMESESYSDDDMCFLTFTYNDDNCPSELDYKDIQSFLKNLRYYCGKLRFFVCGEYGDLFGRPHFHMILFGHNFYEGAKIAGYGSDGVPLFHHPLIDKCWDKGFAEFGQVTPASIQYVAGYVTKKLKADNDKHDVKPFVRMSLKPGIGHNFLLKNKDIIARDSGFYLKGRFYRVDSDSLRFLIREDAISGSVRSHLSFLNDEYARIIANQYKFVSNLDKRVLDKTLAKCYSIANRLGDIYGRKV